MAQAPTSGSSSSSSSSTPSTSSTTTSTHKLSPAAQAIVDRLGSSRSVFVSKDDLSESDEEDLEAAGYAVDPDAVRNGYFVRLLSEFEQAERAQSAH